MGIYFFHIYPWYCQQQEKKQPGGVLLKFYDKTSTADYRPEGTLEREVQDTNGKKKTVQKSFDIILC